ncbi:MAG: UvrD-helicase domain-containing protein [Ardenticatenaceae bacterium]|nr:UvrD-helicase domain-containing protein [Ardenticatenaceae bacterium]MCB9446105.1 UvrD-helicase domain-containing protein [Ardenticatenaceae bacterium]
MDYLNGLNEAQRTAVTAPEGPILVLAGPGSGKTRVLTHRIVYLIREMKVSPWHILAVTFTNKAAKEMRHRVEEMMDGRLRGLMMGTFHSTCARILRRETDNLTYYDKDFVIFDTADQQQVVKQALKDLNLDDKKFPPNKMLNGISNAKNELLTPELYSATNYIAEVTRRVYVRYQDILHANNAMDFDDLLMNVVLLFDERPDVLEKYQQQYHHILVDEFQDTNTAQYALIKRLAAGHGNIFVVGDSDQSIYKWRGADYRNINRFREDYPEAQQILLEQNYRSTQIILDAAKAVIQHNSNRVHKDLFTKRHGGERIVVREAYNDIEEAETIVGTIQNLLLDGRSPSDFAVMYRTNAQSRSIEEAFVRANMPYRLVGATQFYKRREVKDLIAYLRLVHNPLDSVSYGRILNVPTRGIGAKSKEQLEAWAAGKGWSPVEGLIALTTDPDVQHPFNGRAFNALSNFGNMLDAWITLRDQISVGELMDTILEQTGYREYIDDGTEEGEERWANVMELRSVAAEDGSVNLSEFLEQVALVADADNVDETVNATTLLTLHAAKGLEFPVVFITGLEDGILPHSRSFDDGESMAEERRLFYVGITRAEDQLYLSHAFRRAVWGEPDVCVPSRFLGDLPMDLIDAVGTSQRRQEAKSRVSSWNQSSSPAWSPPKPKANVVQNRERPLPQPNHLKPTNHPSIHPTTAKFKTGQKVRHAKFGEGTVIESKLMGSDEEVTVAFPGTGIKRLAASFAKLERLDN